MNGGAIRATLISFVLSNISKMPNPTLVTRKTYLTVCRMIFRAFCVAKISTLACDFRLRERL